ncbi:RsmB/NOP family class I SAM-dependent RNA methyltransferase [Emcibacter sp. SYSU 3D8]|uniref:RsmB/NOP family class I SAM-dependent RNA methyltransferase n=1 Tax=Emcibacter sp. SYSU 3D8 TaxID=3133969 RepID=UPI0031FF460C
MREGARIQAAIDLVAAVDNSTREGGAAADSILRDYFRQRRYAGSKDRRAVGDLLYAVLRRRGELNWRLPGEATPARMAVLLQVILDGADLDGLNARFEGDSHAPAPITAEEAAALHEAAGADISAAPVWASHNFPAWMTASLERRFGGRLVEELAALEGRAPLDLRVNLLRGTVDDALKLLPDASRSTRLTTSLRLETAMDISRHISYLGGFIEIQDEGSQIASLLTGAARGMQVLDLCAGGGGKTLAIAALMGNSGQIYAYDTDRRRLDRLRPRAKRADARTIQYVESQAKLPPGMDRVVLDVPCSGTGTWRRNPELRWRLTPERLTELTRLQDTLLDRGAGLVKPGGQLVYMTCSLLPEEGEDRIAAFLERHPDFAPAAYSACWPATEGGPPASLSASPDYLVLSPATHDTDGFFVAVLQRSP